IIAPSDSTGFIIRNSSGANSADLQQWQDSSSLVFSEVDYRGNLGIGTTSPWARLSVVATSTNSNLPLFIVSTTTGTATSTGLIVTSQGQVGVGTTTPSSPFGLSVSGGLYTSG